MGKLLDSAYKEAANAIGNFFEQTRSFLVEPELDYLREKKRGSSLGFIAKAREGSAEYFIKYAAKRGVSEKEIQQTKSYEELENQLLLIPEDIINEILASPIFEQNLPTRVPQIRLVKLEEDNLFALASKIIPGFKNLHQLQKKLGDSKGHEATIANGILAGDVDINVYNLGEIERVAAKVDHGRAFTVSYNNIFDILYYLRAMLMHHHKEITQKEFGIALHQIQKAKGEEFLASDKIREIAAEFTDKYTSDFSVFTKKKLLNFLRVVQRTKGDKFLSNKTIISLIQMVENYDIKWFSPFNKEKLEQFLQVVQREKFITDHKIKQILATIDSDIKGTFNTFLHISKEKIELTSDQIDDLNRAYIKYVQSQYDFNLDKFIAALTSITEKGLEGIENQIKSRINELRLMGVEVDKIRTCDLKDPLYPYRSKIQRNKGKSDINEADPDEENFNSLQKIEDYYLGILRRNFEAIKDLRRLLSMPSSLLDRNWLDNLNLPQYRDRINKKLQLRKYLEKELYISRIDTKIIARDSLENNPVKDIQGDIYKIMNVLKVKELNLEAKEAVVSSIIDAISEITKIKKADLKDEISYLLDKIKMPLDIISLQKIVSSELHIIRAKIIAKNMGASLFETNVNRLVNATLAKLNSNEIDITNKGKVAKSVAVIIAEQMQFILGTINIEEREASILAMLEKREKADNLLVAKDVIREDLIKFLSSANLGQKDITEKIYSQLVDNSNIKQDRIEQLLDQELYIPTLQGIMPFSHYITKYKLELEAKKDPLLALIKNNYVTAEMIVKYTLDENLKIDNKPPLRWAFENNVEIDGVSATEYAIKLGKNLDGKTLTEETWPEVEKRVKLDLTIKGDNIALDIKVIGAKTIDTAKACLVRDDLSPTEANIIQAREQFTKGSKESAIRRYGLKNSSLLEIARSRAEVGNAGSPPETIKQIVKRDRPAFLSL